MCSLPGLYTGPFARGEIIFYGYLNMCSLPGGELYSMDILTCVVCQGFTQGLLPGGELYSMDISTCVVCQGFTQGLLPGGN